MEARAVSWLKGALRDFETFPPAVQLEARRGLAVAAAAGKSDKAKPLKGLDRGVFELALRYRGEAFRVVYALSHGADVWVVHAFHKKSKTGIKTPQKEIDLIRDRVKRLKE